MAMIRPCVSSGNILHGGTGDGTKLISLQKEALAGRRRS